MSDDTDISNVLDPNPFKKSVYSENGDEVARELYVSVGYALTQWELSESSLGTLFAAFVKPTGGNHIPYRAFGNLLSSGSRRDMVLEAAETYFTYFPNEELFDKIEKTMRLYSDGSRRRDQIAHGVVMGDTVSINPPKFIYFLRPSFYASRNLAVLPPFKSRYRLGSKDIDRYAECFGQLGLRVGKLAQEVHGFYQSLPDELRSRYP
jgi:hypothetical protein